MYVCLEQGKPGRRETMWEAVKQSILKPRESGVRAVGGVKDEAIPLRSGDDVVDG